MGSRHENSENQIFSSSTEIKGEADKNDNGISGAAVAGAALWAVWGLSKLLGSSTVSEADKNDNGVSGGVGVAVGVTVVAGAVALVVWGLSKLFGLAVWSLSKLFGSTKPEENYNMPMASSSSTVSRDCYKPQHRSSDYDDDNKWTKREHGLLKLNTDASLFPKIDKAVAQTQHGLLKLNTDASLFPKIDKAVAADATLMKDSLKWTKPEYGWFKLNTDASVLPKKGYKASAGGLIRDHTGRWIVGFTASLKPCDSTSAELQALRVGLLLAWTSGLKKVKIETDSEQAVILIQNLKVKSENHPLGCIIEKCRNLMKRSDWNIELNHIYREKNMCADALAEMGRDRIDEPLKIWEETPANVRPLVYADMIN